MTSGRETETAWTQPSRTDAGRQLQPEWRYPPPQRLQQAPEGLRRIQRCMQILGLADLPGKLGAEAKIVRHLAGPALNLVV